MEHPADHDHPVGDQHRVEMDHPQSQQDNQSPDRVLVKVHDIPASLTDNMVEKMLENQRYGGGAFKYMEFCDAERTAIVEFEDQQGVSSMFD